MVTYGKWENEWKTKLSSFEVDFKKKTGISVDKVTTDMSYYQQLGGGFSALDAKFKELQEAEKSEKAELLSKALKDFKGQLLKVIAAAKSTADKMDKTQKLSKKSYPYMGTALGILHDAISACIASAESAYADYDKNLAHLNNKWSLFTSKQSRDLKELAKHQEMLKKNLISDVKSALLWIKEQLRSPEAEAFNDGIERETYNIYRYMNEYRARCNVDSTQYKLIEAAMKPVEKWRNAKTVDADASANKVMLALGDLRKMLEIILKVAEKL